MRRGAAVGFCGGLLVVLVSWLGCCAPAFAAGTGSIAGTITGAPSHSPLAGVEVCALTTQNLGGEEVDCVWTGPTGTYEIDSLDEGTYRVHFWPRHGTGLNFLPHYYDFKDFWNFDPVSVGTGQTSGIDAELRKGGSIEGRVTSEVDASPLAGVEVCAKYEYEEREASCGVTDANGNYVVVGLVGREYRLEFFPEYSNLLYFHGYYGGFYGYGSLYGETERWSESNPVPVSFGAATTGVDQALKPYAEVRGVVTAAADGRPLRAIRVCAVPDIELVELDFVRDARCARTNDLGAYSIRRLEAGRYKVIFSLELREFMNTLPPQQPGEDGYATRYWRDGTSWSGADVLTLMAPTTVAAVDARLGPPPKTEPIGSLPSTVAIHPAAVKRRCKHGRSVKGRQGSHLCMKHRGARKDRHHSRSKGTVRR
jgi:hypothetical protein